jgi:cytochrome c-type biogenesis protein CcmE
MMKSPARRKRLFWIAGIALAVSGTAWGVIRAFNDNMVFFYTPTQLLAGEAPGGRSLRIGGMVETGSVEREPGTLTIRFRITDQDKALPVSYTGVLPDLFKEGKGAVAQGELKNGVFVASEILAKHDENYMPPKLKN